MYNRVRQDFMFSLCAGLRKYSGPKWNAMIAVIDRLKLLERHQKTSDCYISDLWSNTRQEQLLLSAHIPTRLLLSSRDGTFLSRGWRDWKRIWVLFAWSEASETSEWRGGMLILAYSAVCTIRTNSNLEQHIIELPKHNEDGMDTKGYKHFEHARNNWS